MALVELEGIHRAYRYVTGGGADGGIIGLNGSVNAAAARTILEQSLAEGRIVFDFGAGEIQIYLLNS